MFDRLLLQIDEAWHDHEEGLRGNINFGIQDSNYEEFLFWLEESIQRYIAIYQLKHIEFSKNNISKFQERNSRYELCIRARKRQIKFIQTQELEMFRHEEVLERATLAMERSMVLLRRLSKPSVVRYPE
jgi:hypothetical protein